MSKSDSTSSRFAHKPEKPNKPCPGFPLFPHAAGVWANDHRPKAGITRRCPPRPETVEELRAVLAGRRGFSTGCRQARYLYRNFPTGRCRMNDRRAIGFPPPTAAPGAAANPTATPGALRQGACGAVGFALAGGSTRCC